MRKLLFALLIATLFTACGAAYNTQLKQVELGMTRDQIVTLMGDKYVTKETKKVGASQSETIEYKDRYKYHWLFRFENDKLVEWWKEQEK